METNDRSAIQMPLEKQDRPVHMSLLRGQKEPKETRVRLVALAEDEDRTQFRDPFKAQELATGKMVKLKAKERLLAYGLMGIQPPRQLVEGLKIYTKIRVRKSSNITTRRTNNGR